MKWPVSQESLDRFWSRLDAETAASRARFPRLARPAVHVGLLAALALALCVGSLSPYKILEGDEALYAMVPKTILLTGDWIHLTYNGEPYFFKPPLNFWITAAFFKILPMNSFTAALGSGLFGALSALMIYFICRIMFVRWDWAFAASLVYLTTHEVLHWTRGVHLETVLNFWTLTGLLCAYLSVGHPAATLGMGVAAGLGWLAKGPQSLYPGVVALILWLSEGIFRRRFFSLWSVAAGLLLVALLAPWFWVRLEEGSGFGHGYFVTELGRTLFGPTQTHNGPFYYFTTLAVTYWPWLPVAFFGAFILARGWRRSLGARAWLAFGVVVAVVLLATAEKRARYLFQLYPLFSVAAGAAVVFAAERYPRVLRGLLVLTVAAGAGLIIFGRKNTAGAPATRDALRVAERLGSVERVWLTRRVENGGRGDPSVSKILGFYAPTLLRSCAAQCDAEAVAGSIVIARPDEAETVARLVGGRIDYANQTLALIATQGAAAK
ncbi:MAG TPA: glycosyltransferase family 39 protein [Verrucomicrobiae bacterium]|nr:glycosyltransferase family 39 protein [Verrucomicrobiae bacterium]